MLELDDIRVRIGSVEAVRGFSMQVAAGELVGLVGRNGAGKTTLVRSLIGLHKQVEGSVSFLGKKMEKLRAIKTVQGRNNHEAEQKSA